MTYTNKFGSLLTNEKAHRETDMKSEAIVIVFRKVAFTMLLALLAMGIGLLPTLAKAQVHQPPPFTFNDRCVPYEVDHAFMLANGVRPDRILTTFGGGADAVAS